MKWLKFSLKNHACQIEENYVILNYLDHVGTMFHGHVQWTKTVKSIEFENFLISDSRT